MVRAVFGMMVEVDPPIKAIIMSIDNDNNHEFVIEDMDETHLLVKENMYQLLKQKLEERLKETQHVEPESGSE